MFRLDGEVHVSYSQIYVESDPGDFGPGMHEAFAGQSVGLCGAAAPGALFLITGLHTGNVGFTVEVRGQAPALDPAWEDVVEVSFYPLSEHSALVQWAGEDSWELDLREGLDYRVRYCAQGMDRAREADVRLDDEPLLDRYLLQFWPAPPEPDRIVRQTSQAAARSHDWARRQPDAELRVRALMAQRRAFLTPEGVESFRDAESPQGTADIAVISREADLQSVREQLTALSSYPAALHWDWADSFVLPAGGRVGYLEAFLEQIGEHAFALGTVLASLESGQYYYLAFVTPTEFEQLSRLLAAHRMSAESVRYGCWTPRGDWEDRPASSMVRAWARANVPKLSAAPEADITWVLESPEETEPDRLA
ncbi:hypothetical protein DFR70_121119 [Nocardia tenerifensis]|uniref:Uncharacterized protein n=1 Tax=Nocardia tenerifensis TaxID=228006 RepID=A0A318K2W4_9NOCA|nr:hypothetical protein [Nocardia tenerifensis]PXX55650.1 hypothetical protein DFR70_121119 [Nocardia tenerifensis]